MDLKKILLSLLVIGVLSFGIIRASGILLFAFSAADADSQETSVILVERGQNRKTLSRKLAKKGVITDASSFILLGKLTRNWGALKQGEYEVSARMTPLEIFEVLTSGVSVAFPQTFQEGINLYQIAGQLHQAGYVETQEFIRLCKSAQFMRELGFSDPLPPSLEGYLFPDTYLFSRAMSAKEIIQAMVRRFEKAWTDELATRAKEMGMSRHKTVTLASMVEKETGAPEERPRISSVFHNRLKKRMRLESDPTTIYGMWERYNGNIQRKHLREKNDYNTYQKYGLPIGAIANPGSEALSAALHPEETDFLYFVSRNDGTHEFTPTYKEHQAAVRRYQLNRNARRGKSWRDLNKKK